MGYAEIEYGRTVEYFAPDDSESSLKEAYASLLIEGDEITRVSHKTVTEESGVRIVMDVGYLHRISINLT